MPRSLTTLDELELEALNNFSNRTVGVIASARHCVGRGLPLSASLASEMAEQLARANSETPAPNKGRRGNDLASYRQDYIDFIRWDAVKEVREKQQELREQLADLEVTSGMPPSALQDRRKMLQWTGNTLVRAFECASMILQGTAAHSGPGAIKRSYFIVKNSDEPSKYKLLDGRTLKAIGLGDSWLYRRSKEFTPLYDLTL